MKELNIDTETYRLPNTNFHQIEFGKSQIVIGHTFNSGMYHYNGWLKRSGGEYKSTANFTIDTDGKIYQHFDPKYFSEFVNIKGANESVISIVLVNEGWLEKNELNDNYITISGNIYDSETIVERKWRNRKYWVPYTDEQFTSLVSLCEYICKKYDIYLKTIGHNTKVDTILDYNGITFRSNYSKEFTDLSPAFDFVSFKNNLETKTNNHG